MGMSKKRKSPDVGFDHNPRASPYDRRLNLGSSTPSVSRSPSVSSIVSTASEVVYNGILDEDENGFIFCHNVSSLFQLSCVHFLNILLY